MEKKVTKRVAHDRLSLSVRYATGGLVRFSISRSGENIDLAGSNDPKEGRRQLAVLDAFLKSRGSETNLDRLERLEVVARQANSVSELVALMGQG